MHECINALMHVFMYYVLIYVGLCMCVLDRAYVFMYKVHMCESVPCINIIMFSRQLLSFWI